MEHEFEKIIDYMANKGLDLEDYQLLHQKAQEINPKILVEIGSRYGASSLLLGIIARNNVGHLYCIEPKPKKQWWINIKNYELLPWITLIKQKSPWITTEYINIFEKKIDFLFIDGNHKFRHALVDYHYFFPFVKVEGYIAFHDYWGERGVRMAIDAILKDNHNKIIEIGCTPKSNYRGTIIFKKINE